MSLKPEEDDRRATRVYEVEKEGSETCREGGVSNTTVERQLVEIRMGCLNSIDIKLVWYLESSRPWGVTENPGDCLHSPWVKGFRQAVLNGVLAWVTEDRVEVVTERGWWSNILKMSFKASREIQILSLPASFLPQHGNSQRPINILIKLDYLPMPPAQNFE